MTVRHGHKVVHCAPGQVAEVSAQLDCEPVLVTTVGEPRPAAPDAASSVALEQAVASSARLWRDALVAAFGYTQKPTTLGAALAPRSVRDAVATFDGDLAKSLRYVADAADAFRHLSAGLCCSADSRAQVFRDRYPVQQPLGSHATSSCGASVADFADDVGSGTVSRPVEWDAMDGV